MDDLGMSAQMWFWSKGHPNGAYIAREIIETFGAGSGGVPADLRGSGAGAPPAGTGLRENVAVIDALEAKYWRG